MRLAPILGSHPAKPLCENRPSMELKGEKMKILVYVVLCLIAPYGLAMAAGPSVATVSVRVDFKNEKSYAISLASTDGKLTTVDFSRCNRIVSGKGSCNITVTTENGKRQAAKAYLRVVENLEDGSTARVGELKVYIRQKKCTKKSKYKWRVDFERKGDKSINITDLDYNSLPMSASYSNCGESADDAKFYLSINKRS